MYSEILATGYMDIDPIGYYFNIVSSKDRVYFPAEAIGIARVFAEKAFLRLPAKIRKGEKGMYFAESFELMPLN